MSYEQKMSNPETGRMFDEYARLIRETIEIPNAMLPERFRDGRMVYGSQHYKSLKIRSSKKKKPKANTASSSEKKQSEQNNTAEQWESNPDSPLT